MKKLTKEEAEMIPTRGKGHSTNFRAALLALKQGEYLFLKTSEWHWRSKSAFAIPAELKRRSYGRIRFDCQKALDGSGWLIKRVK